jgi:urease accessory protein
MRKYLPLLLLAFSVPRSPIPATGRQLPGRIFPSADRARSSADADGAGVLSALSGRKLLLPFATLGMMLVGAIAGSLLGGFSGMEMLIIASLAVCGVMMFKTENRLLLAVPALAMFHGWAHGVEMSGHSFWLFTSGFMFASATVLCASFAAGLLLRRHDGLRKTFGGGLIVSALLALMS